jgi:hypothetical protein
MHAIHFVRSVQQTKPHQVNFDKFRAFLHDILNYPPPSHISNHGANLITGFDQ